MAIPIGLTSLVLDADPVICYHCKIGLALSSLVQGVNH